MLSRQEEEQLRDIEVELDRLKRRKASLEVVVNALIMRADYLRGKQEHRL